MQGLRTRSLLLVGFVAAVAAACTSGADPARPAVDSSDRPAAPPAGHRRMVALLEQVAAEVLEGNAPYVGRGQLAELRQRLAALPAEGSDTDRLLHHLALGRHELRLGNIDAGIEHHGAAYRLLPRVRADLPPERVAETVLELGVAFMRKGETDNCVLRHTADSCLMPIGGDGVHLDKSGSRQAVRFLTEVLKITPPRTPWHLRARWLLNIASMTLGEHPDGVPEAYRIPRSVFESDEPFPRFPEVAPRLGVNTFDLSGGAVAEDFDGDGVLELMTSTLDPIGQLRYFDFDVDGQRYVEATAAAGLEGLVGGLNLVHADYDNDGDADVLVLRGAWFRRYGAHPNSLLRNAGDGTFVDVTFESGLGRVHYPTQTAAWGDFDLDGDLDLYVGNETDEDVDAPCELFRNEGDGTFVDVAGQAGVRNERFTKAVVWGDYDHDRYPDLYVSNLGGENRLYHNEGDGTFTDVGRRAGVTRPLDSFPVWFWDFDNDGHLDLYVSAYGGDVADVAASYLAYRPRVEPMRLYRGDGAGGFEDVAAKQGLGRTTLPMGANFGDLDNDGYPDFYLGTGYPSYEGLMPNLMFRNRGGHGFSDVTTAGGFGHLQKGHAVVFADLDNDGDQDVFEQMGGGFPGDAFGNALYANPGFDHHWLKVSLVGVRSNRAGIGARIRLDVVDDGRPRTIYRHVTTGGSFGSNPLRQTLGVGAAERIERLEVTWPASDATQVFETLDVDQWLEITEDRATPRRRTLTSFALER